MSEAQKLMATVMRRHPALDLCDGGIHTMSDPTVQARARAMGYITNGFASVSLGYAAEVGAQEALAPIRAECERLRRINVPGDDVHMVIDRLAKFIYSTEELER